MDQGGVVYTKSSDKVDPNSEAEIDKRNLQETSLFHNTSYYFGYGVFVRDIVALLNLLGGIFLIVAASFAFTEVEYLRDAKSVETGAFDAGYMLYMWLFVAFLLMCISNGLSFLLSLLAQMNVTVSHWWPEHKLSDTVLIFVFFAFDIASIVLVGQGMSMYTPKGIEFKNIDECKDDSQHELLCSYGVTKGYVDMYGALLIRSDTYKYHESKMPEYIHDGKLFFNEIVMGLAILFIIRAVVVFIGLWVAGHRPLYILGFNRVLCDSCGCGNQGGRPTMEHVECGWSLNGFFSRFANDQAGAIRNHDWVSSVFYFIGFLVLATGLNDNSITGSYIPSKDAMKDWQKKYPDTAATTLTYNCEFSVPIMDIKNYDFTSGKLSKSTPTLFMSKDIYLPANIINDESSTQSINAIDLVSNLAVFDARTKMDDSVVTSTTTVATWRTLIENKALSNDGKHIFKDDYVNTAWMHMDINNIMCAAFDKDGRTEFKQNDANVYLHGPVYQSYASAIFLRRRLDDTGGAGTDAEKNSLSKADAMNLLATYPSSTQQVDSSGVNAFVRSVKELGPVISASTKTTQSAITRESIDQKNAQLGITDASHYFVNTKGDITQSSSNPCDPGTTKVRSSTSFCLQDSPSVQTGLQSNQYILAPTCCLTDKDAPNKYEDSIAYRFEVYAVFLLLGALFMLFSVLAQFVALTMYNVRARPIPLDRPEGVTMPGSVI